MRSDLTNVVRRCPSGWVITIRGKLRRFLATAGYSPGTEIFYALNLSERLGVEQKGGVLRVGLVHYNAAEEVDRLLGALREFAAP